VAIVDSLLEQASIENEKAEPEEAARKLLDTDTFLRVSVVLSAGFLCCADAVLEVC
jgi:hypothetical protein